MAEESINDRALGAIVGALAVDAATMGLHWIYDTAKIDELVSDGSPLFFEPPSCPYYQYAAGKNSPYGDELLWLLKSVSDNKGFEKNQFTQDQMAQATAYTGRLNHATKDFITNVEAGQTYPETGADTADAHGALKSAIVVALYAGSPDLLQRMEEATRVHQNNAVAVEFALATARMLERVVLGESSVVEALDWGVENVGGDAAAALATAIGHAKAGLPARDAVGKMGRACSLPGSFQGAMHALYLHSSDGLEATAVANVLAAGDQCSRAILIGAFMGAAGGLGSLPDEWRAKATDFQAIHDMATVVVACRGGASAGEAKE